MEPPQAQDQSAKKGSVPAGPKVTAGKKGAHGRSAGKSGEFEFLPVGAQFRAAGGPHGENSSAILLLINQLRSGRGIVVA